ncbi:Gfo/Idh/MocA family oxidoreductase [Cohnella faecalis]|uniref:hypothetical protein n=1 Tax=Cohnella faecalis TaxID=2315694 RepID=UPI0026CF38D4|nr:hypothetical protein [Cohnella faecalis]
MTKLRIGMISFAHSHAYDYLDILSDMPQVEVAAISDDVPQRSELLAASRSIPYFSDYRELLADRRSMRS